jgi:hypothetical protein
MSLPETKEQDTKLDELTHLCCFVCDPVVDGTVTTLCGYKDLFTNCRTSDTFCAVCVDLNPLHLDH